MQGTLCGAALKAKVGKKRAVRGKGVQRGNR